MPIAILATNQPAKLFTDDVRKSFIELLSKQLHKSQDLFVLHIIPDSMCSMGTALNEPVVLMNIKAMGHLTAEENIGHTAAISRFIQSTLGIGKDRIVIHFQPMEAHEIGKKGTTLKDLWESGLLDPTTGLPN